MDYTNFINTALKENNISEPSPESLKKLSDFVDRLVAVNEQMNLTAITDPEEIAVKHVADSLECIEYIKNGAKLLDVGSGAGFPAVPIAVCRPDLSVTALDSTAKKIKFIADTASTVKIDNLSAIVGRAEELCSTAKKDYPIYREKYDVVTARAVARLNVLCELCLPFVKIGGVFISMKSRLASDEIDEARQAVKILGGEIAENVSLSITCKGEELSRSLIIIQKISPTPRNYPRSYSSINKKPL